MTAPNDDPNPNLDDVIDPHEVPHPDHREHAKESAHLDEDELERRTRLERAEVESDRERPS